MGVLSDRVILGDGPPRLRSSDRSINEIVADLAAGGSAKGREQSGPLAPIDMVAALAVSALGDVDALGPGLIQARPPQPDLVGCLFEASLSRWFKVAPRTAVLALSAGLLQIHDFWDASHVAAQKADDLGERGSSAYWHGIAHRREPDASNAAYWFRRVGGHVVFKPLAQAAEPWLDAHGDAALLRGLTAAGAWNPFAMVDLCSDAHAGTSLETLARRIQRAEMWLLLEASFAAVAGPTVSA